MVATSKTGIKGNRGSGTWGVLVSGNILCGPFKGQSSAMHYAQEMRTHGVSAVASRLLLPSQVDTELASRVAAVAQARVDDITRERARVQRAIIRQGWKEGDVA